MKVSRPTNNQKVQTERAQEDLDTRLVTDRDRAQSSLTNSSNIIKYKNIKDAHPLREYKHYDIINNKERVYFN